MNCPSCKKSAFETVQIEQGLEASRCGGCRGLWIAGEKYWEWLRSKGPNLPELSGEGKPIAQTDSQSAKLCPNCGRWLIKYKVGHGLPFFVEHCGQCEGVWLDESEWESLKARNLHDDLQFICDSLWQGKVLREEHEQIAQARYARILGADFEKARQVRDWITDHPNRSALVAFLVDHLPPAARGRL